MTGKWLICLLACLLAIPPAIAQNYGNIKPNTVIGNPDPQASKPAIPRQFDFYSPMDFGAKGNGTTDDTVAMQKAINAAQHGGTLILGPRLYGIGSNLTASGPIRIIGSYSGSGLRVAGPAFGSCTTGIRQLTANITVLTLTGTGSAVKDVCFDAVGLNNTAGVGIQIGPPPSGAVPISNNLIEGNGFEGFCTSIDATGNTGGLQIVENYIVRNFIQPANNTGCAGIRVGRLSAGGSTTDTHMYNNFIPCAFDGPSNQSLSNVDGILINDSGGSFARGNDIVACLHGTKIFPGANQVVAGLQFASTVVGDSSKVNDLLIDTAAASGAVTQAKITGSWMSGSLGSSAVIQNTGGGTIRGISFIGDNIYPRQTANGVDVLAGDDINFVGGSVCAQNVSNMIMLNIVTPGHVGVHDMLIGACDSGFGGNYNVQYGIWYAPTTAGQISITGNTFNDQVISAIHYAPTVEPANAVIADNVGVDDVATFSQPSATTTNIPIFPTFSLTGNATISTFTGGWPGRCVNIIPGGSWSVVTGGNINPPFTATIGVMKRACYSGSIWYFQ